MAIVRNKKPQPADPAAIAAFGAEAEEKPPAAPAQTSKQPSMRRKQSERKPPASTLIRWDEHEGLRDSLIQYAREERYPVHTVLLEALALGLTELKGKQS